MARLARLTIPGLPHHILQSGAGVPVFRSDDDCLFYIECLQRCARESGVALYAYLLLPESVRLIASPRSVSSLSIFMRRLSRRYAVWYNRAHSHTGPVWQGRFHSSVLEPASLQKLTLYMEGLPVREGFVKRPEQYV